MPEVTVVSTFPRRRPRRRLFLPALGLPALLILASMARWPMVINKLQIGSPIFEHFAGANPRIAIRYFDRDTHADLAGELKICGGARVPVLVFLSEDGFEVMRYGDRTLSRYRKLAADQFGPACPTGLVPPEQHLLDAVTQDWVDIFERVQLILRTSSRLRQKHGDWYL